MLVQCAKSCDSCTGRSRKRSILPNGKTFGVPQKVEGPHAKGTLLHIRETEKYMMEEVHADEKYREVREGCKNTHELCSFWAHLGECESNPKYMELECAPACKACIKLDFDTRCPWDRNAPTVWGPGDLNKMFTRITTEPFYKQYGPKVLSKPKVEEGETGVQGGPWVITLDNVLTDEECDRLIKLGGLRGYEQSYDVGDKKPDGTYDKVSSFFNRGSLCLLFMANDKQYHFSSWSRALSI
jgi:prolyl 4-hydroxylase